MRYAWAEARLLPCPFCGGRAQVLPQRFHGDGWVEKAYLVKCTICSASKLSVSKYQPQAIAVWNHRTPLSDGKGQ